MVGVAVETDIAVVGAGMAGVSVACHLTATATTILLEQESQPAYHTTGRSAAMYLESYGNPAIRELTTQSRAVFDAAGDLLTPRPLLWVAAHDQQDELAALHAMNATLQPVDEPEARKLCPVLRPGRFAAALLEPGALEIDVLGLHQHYLGIARRQGLQVLLNAPVRAGGRRGDRWVLDTAAGEVHARVVVNAAGAWADEVARRLGVPPVGLRPLRRTAVVCRAEGVDGTWPLVSDIAEQFYFRPEGAGVLISPADETPSDPCDARPEDLAVALAIERVNEATTLGLRSVVTAWAGLRTFTPDRSPVVGPDPVEPTFHWLAGQGGYGIQIAPALAELAAGLVTSTLATSTAEPAPAALAVNRFR